MRVWGSGEGRTVNPSMSGFNDLSCSMKNFHNEWQKYVLLLAIGLIGIAIASKFRNQTLNFYMNMGSDLGQIAALCIINWGGWPTTVMTCTAFILRARPLAIIVIALGLALVHVNGKILVDGARQATCRITHAANG